MSITHQFVSGVADGTDATQVQPSNWNAAHVLTTPSALNADTGVVLGQDVSGAMTLSGVAAASAMQYLRRKAGVVSKTYEFAALNYTCNTDFDFAAITGGVNLTGGITNTVTLTPVPLGVNGTDAGHYLYISGGSTGAAEAVLITGGTATSGASTGTITFVPANSHTGAWTFTSASAGIAEALNVNLCIFLAPGLYNIYATITPPTNSQIVGSGSGIYSNGGTTLQFNSANTKFFKITNDGVKLANVTLTQNASVAAVSGNIGIYCSGSGSGVTGEVNNWSYIHDVAIKLFYYGFYNNGGGGVCDANRIFIDSCVSTGLVSCSGQGFYTNITVEFCGTKQTTPVVKMDGGHGVYIRPCPGGSCGVPPWFSGIQTFSNYGYGFYADEVMCTISGTYSYFNNDRAGELYLSASGNVSNFTAENAGVSVGPFSGVQNTTAVGLEIGPMASNLIISNGKINNCNGIGLLANGSNTQITGCQLFSNGLGLVAGSLYGIKLLNVSNISVIDCRITDPVLVSGCTGTHFSHCVITGGTLTLPSLLLTATSLYNFVAQNWIQNVHAGASIQIDAASSIVEGDNFCAGTITNNGTFSINSFSNCPSKKSRSFYVATESGANNALVILLPGITPINGDLITISLAHSLQIGANTISINAVSFNIKRMKNVSSNLTAAYLSSSVFICVVNGTDVLDITQ